MYKILVLLAGCFLISTQSHAVEVKTLSQSTKTLKITAQNVNGVRISLSQKIQKTDCNKRTISADAIFLGGNEENGKPVNWNSRYFIESVTYQNEMYCPLNLVEEETIYSQILDFPSFTNENIKKEVIISIVVPSTVDVNVTEY